MVEKTFTIIFKQPIINVNVTPHFARLTKDALERIRLDGAKQIFDVLEEPKWPVN